MLPFFGALNKAKASSYSDTVYLEIIHVLLVPLIYTTFIIFFGLHHSFYYTIQEMKFCPCIHCNSRFFTACTFILNLFFVGMLCQSNNKMRIASTCTRSAQYVYCMEHKMDAKINVNRSMKHQNAWTIK